MNNKRNPHNICTWKDISNCIGCSIKERLHCRWSPNILTAFIVPAFGYILMATLDLVVFALITGVWWTLIGFFG
jgi:hypothetical protein